MPSVDSDNSRSNLLVSLAPSPCNPKGRQDRQSAGGSGMDARGSGISVLLARSPSAQKGGKTKKALDAMAWMQEAGPAQHLYFCSAEHNRCSGQLTARQRKSPYGCLRKKSRSCCPHFDVGARSPTPQFQCCYLRTDLAYKNRLFFRTASALVKHKPINIEITGAGVGNAR